MSGGVDEDRPSSASSDSGSHDDNDEIQDLPCTPTPPVSPIKATPPKSPTKGVPNRRRMRTTSISKSHATQGSMVRYGTRTIYTAGRPPWYDSHGHFKEAFVIGICGGSASGKTTVAKRIIEALEVPWVSLLSLDSFYKVLSEEQHQAASRNEYNFDHPDAFDFDLVCEKLQELKTGRKVEIPVYNFSTHAREKEQQTIYGANVVIFEGILAFASKEMMDLMDMKVFVDTDSDIRLARRLKRDITDRGREIEGVIKQYDTFVKPAFDHYIGPSKTHADIIVPRGGENLTALGLIVNHVRQQLTQRGLNFRHSLIESHKNQPLPNTLHVLNSSKQLKGLHTFVRNRDICRDEFVFYSNRLMRLLIEHALSFLPYKEFRVETPQNDVYIGKKLAVEKLCGVSILRAGETLEPALQEVCKDISLGKILIQTNLSSGEPELHFIKLPRDISKHHVILMDATVATGAAAMMGIRVLIDHGVPEENILLVSLIMAESGVHSVAYAYPNVKMITTAVDPEISDKFHILPGIGNFGDRYFGTEPIYS